MVRDELGGNRVGVDYHAGHGDQSCAWAAERTTRVSDQIGLWGGFILTLMVFSYLLGDNFLYRLAIYVFVGLTAGFVTIVTIESVLLPWFRLTIQSGDTGGTILGALPLLIGVLLLLKGSRRF